jgi:diaminopimelate epimerase
MPKQQQHFYKYHGAGNDFIMLDGRNTPTLPQKLSQQQIAHLCHRHFGIGADGLIILCPPIQAHTHFHMLYYNADGALGSMCGNGGRCAVAFANQLGALPTTATNEVQFTAADGLHTAHILPNGTIQLHMTDVHHITQVAPRAWVLDTGSPHYVTFVDDVATTEVVAQGKTIRYSEMYTQKGINVNFVQILAQHPAALFVATYERGVEDETLACGTGVTAAALAAHKSTGITSPVHITTKGGLLQVHFRALANESFTDIYLTGPTQLVFEGWITI